MVGQGARQRRVARCQSWEHIEPCLEPGHAPSTGAERGWVREGIQKGKNDEEKKACRHIKESGLCGPLYSSVCVGEKVVVFAIVKLGGKTASKAISLRGSGEGVICLLQMS